MERGRGKFGRSGERVDLKCRRDLHSGGRKGKEREGKANTTWKFQFQGEDYEGPRRFTHFKPFPYSVNDKMGEFYIILHLMQKTPLKVCLIKDSKDINLHLSNMGLAAGFFNY